MLGIVILVAFSFARQIGVCSAAVFNRPWAPFIHGKSVQRLRGGSSPAQNESGGKSSGYCVGIDLGTTYRYSFNI